MNRGFSLVELSIVLVILGLLTGGILAGQSLIRASELRALTTESQQMVTSLHTFRDKYFALPGDMTNATSFWGKDSTYCNGQPGIANAVTGTCNGNGSGIWDTAGAGNVTDERFQAIRQLALAGLMNGSYTGITGAGGTHHCIADVNCPRSKLNQGMWGSAYGTTASADTFAYAVDYGNYLIVGAPIANSGPFGELLKPEEAWNIDTKMDDARPAYGRVVARFWNNKCAAPDSGAAANTNLNASYRLSDSSAQCALYFVRN